MFFVLQNVCIREMLIILVKDSIIYKRKKSGLHTYKGKMIGNIERLKSIIYEVDKNFNKIYVKSTILLPTRYIIPDLDGLKYYLKQNTSYNYMIKCHDTVRLFVKYLEIYDTVYTLTKDLEFYKTLEKHCLQSSHPSLIVQVLKLIPYALRKEYISKTLSISHLSADIIFGKVN